MIRKIIRFLSKPLKTKIIIINNLNKRVLKKIIALVIKPCAIFFVKTRLGRDSLYSEMPKNELLIGNTDEGLKYIVNTSDNVIGRSIFRDRRSYDSQHLLTTLSLIGQKKSVLLDVGANLGTIGILGISKGLFDKCIAFEPDPTNFKLLNANVHLNGLADKFELRNEALSSEGGCLLDFELSEDNYGDHRIQINKKHGKDNEDKRFVITVAVNTLDAVLESCDLNECLLFMDTQGFEGHVLCGANSLLQARAPIVTEFWPYGLKRSDGLELFYSVLTEAKYTTIYDLRYPEKKLKFSVDVIKTIASELGDNGNFTDLVLLNE